MSSSPEQPGVAAALPQAALAWGRPTPGRQPAARRPPSAAGRVPASSECDRKAAERLAEGAPVSTSGCCHAHWPRGSQPTCGFQRLTCPAQQRGRMNDGKHVALAMSPGQSSLRRPPAGLKFQPPSTSNSVTAKDQTSNTATKKNTFDEARDCTRNLGDQQHRQPSDCQLTWRGGVLGAVRTCTARPGALRPTATTADAKDKLGPQSAMPAAEASAVRSPVPADGSVSPRHPLR